MQYLGIPLSGEKCNPIQTMHASKRIYREATPSKLTENNFSLWMSLSMAKKLGKLLQVDVSPPKQILLAFIRTDPCGSQALPLCRGKGEVIKQTSSKVFIAPISEQRSRKEQQDHEVSSSVPNGRMNSFRWFSAAKDTSNQLAKLSGKIQHSPV